VIAAEKIMLMASVETDECILWDGGSFASGYPRVKIDGKNRRGNRVVCTEHHGAPPSDDSEAAHSCGVPACINPRHLRWATREENQADRLIHGTHNHGERNPNSKLTSDDVADLRSLYGEGGVSTRALGRRYGISHTQVRDILHGRSWSW
jgi:hypothetical protein